MDITEMQRELRALTDRAEITDLLDRYLRSLDEGVIDEEWARAFHTEDVTAEMPVGTVHGRDAVLATVGRAMALFDRTVHLGAGPVIEIDGDRATARGAQLSTHVLADGSEEVFVSAGRTDTELVRTTAGWRISATALRIAWTQGTPPRLPEAPAGAPEPAARR
ncbi:nuclear transport factor 2 family protein [Streptomyces sp. ISL-10]|uniref:nuclear transport factor 2 family protein n=1 Tax=Streptomyces sp. ISL-10 TaxID=2819172 RepID=UPI001BE74F66|nr:nuclear transport factor 2 family protein [Streptomyces sp. ISL-10]MBT2367099.1 nuclear transport factor 2 family protein [Streptomyces sp. ISL-10]